MKSIVAMIGLLAACGGGEGSNGSISPADLPLASARIQCAKLDECCTLEEFMDETLGAENIMECEALFGGFGSIITTLIDDGVANGRLVYHGDRVADCFAELEDQSCSEFRRAVNEDLGSCTTPFEPLVADGGQCGEDFDCTSGFCVGESIDFETRAITYGVCGTAPGAGQDCVDGDCDDGLYCDGSICAAPQADGAPCGSDDECASGACNGDFGSGTCGAIMTCDGK